MKVPVDYFGVAGDSLVRALLDQSSNKRARKTAFNNLVRLAKACGAIEKQYAVKNVNLRIEADGSQWIAFSIDTFVLPLAEGAPK